jgi:hypothetical protein
MAIKRLERLSTEHGARQLLERLIAAKRCTLEDLDAPPPGHLNPGTYRNLLRDPEHYASPHVQVTDPRDFQPETAETPLPY